jgi:membrane protease YdiL (CAAX protease family)
MGMALAIAYVVTRRNLWSLILAHAYMDTLLLVQLYNATPPGGTR